MSFITECEAFVNKVKAKVESIDWNAVQTYWTQFYAGLEQALPVVEALFPGTKSTVAAFVTPVMADANTAVTSLVSTIASVKAGTASNSTAVAAATATSAAVTDASKLLGALLDGAHPAVATPPQAPAELG